MKRCFNTERLKARIVEKYGDQKSFAEALGTSESTISRYLSEGRDWKGSLIIKAIRLLDIPDDEVNTYFFEPKVAITQPERSKV